jgi:hypothetical protein
MGYSGDPSPCSRFVRAGLAYVYCFFVFMVLVMILEPHRRGSDWRGWELVSRGVFAFAMVWFLVGTSLLMWAVLRQVTSRSKGRFAAQASRCPGVWDKQLDG